MQPQGRRRFALFGKIVYGVVVVGLLLFLPVLQAWDALPEGGGWAPAKLVVLALALMLPLLTRRRAVLHLGVVLVLLVLGGLLFARNQGLLPEAPAKADARILRRAAAMLAIPAAWDRGPQRSCSAKKNARTLYCALRAASLEEVGSFRHRRPALQVVRSEIGRLRPQSAYEHRLSGFNSDPEVTFADLDRLLDASLSSVEARIGQEK